MELWELLGVRAGITVLIGGGGKTTAMYTLAGELQRLGTVVCTTTTHILPPEHLPVSDGCPMPPDRCVCLGTPAAEGKLTAPPVPQARWRSLADYVLVEADGSRGLPVKAHLSHEPVIPAGAGLTVLLIGGSAFGRPVQEAVHRWERFCRLTGAAPEEPVTPENLARLVAAEGLGDKIFVNQAGTPGIMSQARRLAALLDRPVYAGELQGGYWTCLS